MEEVFQIVILNRPRNVLADDFNQILLRLAGTPSTLDKIELQAMGCPPPLLRVQENIEADRRNALGGPSLCGNPGHDAVNSRATPQHRQARTPRVMNAKHKGTCNEHRSKQIAVREL